jgi:hypothetical protein
MTTPHEQLLRTIAAVEPRYDLDDWAFDVLRALSDVGAVVLMPMKVSQVPKGSKVHLSPPIVSLNWPEGAYRPFVNGECRVYVDALKDVRPRV